MASIGVAETAPEKEAGDEGAVEEALFDFAEVRVARGVVVGEFRDEHLDPRHYRGQDAVAERGEAQEPAQRSRDLKGMKMHFQMKKVHRKIAVGFFFFFFFLFLLFSVLTEGEDGEEQGDDDA